MMTLAFPKTPDSAESRWNLDVLMLAGIHEKEVEFYYKHDDHERWRRVVVKSVEYKQDKDAFYIMAFDCNADGYRMFRLDRIIGSVVVG